MAISISSLLEKSFSSRSFDEKRTIVERGKPKPDMPNLTTVCKQGTKTTVRTFVISEFEETSWLTGCSTKNKLFCWPCILFSTESSVWNKLGYSDLNHLTVAVRKHETSRRHLEAFFALNTFGRQRIDTALSNQRLEEVSRHNENVRANREVLRTLINATCFLARQELPFRGHNESETSSNRGNYIELLEYTRGYDAVLNGHLQAATVFKGTSPSVQNSLIKAIADVMLDTIKEQIDEANFVSIILVETSDIATKSQLSTVVRYVYKGKVFERYLGFTDVSADRTAAGLMKHVEKVVENYTLEEKLVGQTYDGASVMSGQLSGLQKRVLDKYPKALFVHCHAHLLNLVLQQGLQSMRQCHISLKTLSGLAAFFTKSSTRSHALKEFVHRRLPTIAPTRWNFTSRLSNTVKEYRSELISFFNSIVESSESWDNDAVVKARGFLNFLEEPQTVFLLHVFAQIFGMTDVLYDILQCKSFDVMYCKDKIDEVRAKLLQERNTGFNSVWDSATSDSTDDNEASSRPRRNQDFDSETNKVIHSLLYQDIIDSVCCQIDQRFTAVTKFEFFQLLCCDKFPEFKKKFPDRLMKKLQDVYGGIFDYPRLKSELQVVYSLPEFSQQTVQNMYEYVHQNSLSSGFKELFNLSQLVLTIPSTTASAERSFSALKRIHTCLRSTQGQERLSSLSLLSIEKGLLLELKQKQAFYDDVIKKFIAQKRRIELCYR